MKTFRFSKHKLVASLTLCSLLLIMAAGWDLSEAQTSCGPYHFYDSTSAHDATYTGSEFQLSQDYPQQMPTRQAKPWTRYDFRTQPQAYLRSVLKYVIQGNVPVDFEGQRNAVRKWYHAPGLVGNPQNPGAREYINGLTRERGLGPGKLHANQLNSVSNYAVSMYNSLGGYVIGQVWCNPQNPDASKADFPDGTVAFKLLFTTATVNQVPYLANSLEWDAYAVTFPPAGGGATPPHWTKVLLLQVDIAVRDSRADAQTGWVFGTFVYDGTRPGKTVWDRLVPVGLMWGNDGTLTHADATAGATPVESIILNPVIAGETLDLGRDGRLNGPVDNPRSSCLSCHSTAQQPQATSYLPPASMAEPLLLSQYFQNIHAPDVFQTPGTSLDYSLQLSVGIPNARKASATYTPTP